MLRKRILIGNVLSQHTKHRRGVAGKKCAVIQKAIWEVTDGQGLTTATKNELLAL